jgi:hypothetical protein
MSPVPAIVAIVVAAQAAPSRDQATTHAVPAADTAALSLVALLFFCVACFAWGAAILGRRERQLSSAPDERDQLPHPAGEPPPPAQPAQPPNPWERDSDWWKKDG